MFMDILVFGLCLISISIIGIIISNPCGRSIGFTLSIYGLISGFIICGVSVIMYIFQI
jgi:hypothetical protein